MWQWNNKCALIDVIWSPSCNEICGNTISKVWYHIKLFIAVQDVFNFFLIYLLQVWFLKSIMIIILYLVFVREKLNVLWFSVLYYTLIHCHPVQKNTQTKLKYDHKNDEYWWWQRRDPKCWMQTSWQSQRDLSGLIFSSVHKGCNKSQDICCTPKSF